MPKPTDTFTFATGTNYTVGPFIGLATKVLPGDIINGFVPGTGIIPEHVNYLTNICGQWIDGWLVLGSSAAGLDAHIVETNASGDMTVAAAQFGMTASGSFALRVSENSGATGTAILATNSSGLVAITASSNGGAGAVLDLDKTDVTSTGVVVQANNAGSGDVINAVGATGVAVRGENTSVNSTAVFRNLGTGEALTALKVAGGTVAALFGQQGAGVPVRGTINLQSSLIPSAGQHGDIYMEPGAAGVLRGGIRYFDNDGGPGGGTSGWQRAWTTENGIGYAYGSSEGSTNDTTGVLVNKLTVTLDSSVSPGIAQGKYLVNYSCNVSLPGAVPTSTRAIVEFWAAGAMHTRVEMDFAALGQAKPVACIYEVTLGVSALDLEIYFRTNSAPDGVICSNARISAQGAFE